MVIRSYSCLNRRCQTEFDSSGDFPPCPRCRGLRVQWVPRPVAIRSSATTAIDATARQIATDYGLTNFATPERGKPAIRPAPGPQPTHSPHRGEPNVFEPQPGWRVKLPDNVLAANQAACMPAGVTAKIKVDPNAGALNQTNWGTDRIRNNTRIEGTHRPK